MQYKMQKNTFFFPSKDGKTDLILILSEATVLCSIKIYLKLHVQTEAIVFTEIQNLFFEAN